MSLITCPPYYKKPPSLANLVAGRFFTLSESLEAISKAPNTKAPGKLADSAILSKPGTLSTTSPTFPGISFNAPTTLGAR